MTPDFLSGLSIGILIGLLASCGAVIAEYRRKMYPTIHLFMPKDAPSAKEMPIANAFLELYERNDDDEWHKDFQVLAEMCRAELSQCRTSKEDKQP